MRNATFLLLLLLALASLNCKSDNNTATGELGDKTSEVTQETSAADETETTIDWTTFKAGGNEPSWDVTIDAVDGVLVYELGLEMGTVIKTGNAEVLMYSNDIISVQLDSDKEVTQFQILNKPCADDADISYSKSTFFTLDGRTYRGCGGFQTDEEI